MNNTVYASDVEQKYLMFIIENQSYAMCITDVIEIVGIKPITEIPENPQHAKGVINLRDKVIPVIDMHMRFHIPEMQYDNRTCIVITRIKGNDIGIIVDEVHEVVDIYPSQISEPSNLHGNPASHCVFGVAKVNDTVTFLIDSEKVLSDNDSVLKMIK